MTEARRLVDKLWSYCNVLRDDGVSTIEYTEQLTYLLFLEMAHEREARPLMPERIVPAHCSWQRLLDADGDELELTYRHILEDLARQPGVLGVVFRKAQNRIQDPAELKRLIVDLIDKENWSASGTDIKGDAYESLLAKGAEDIKSGAGQYFTPRPAHGVELVDGTARLAAMNLILHGIGKPTGQSLVEVKDALLADPGQRYSVVLSHPPFGRKSSITMVGADGREAREDREIERADFVVTTANKQLNFLQHIATILKMNGRAAVVLPDNVLFFDKRPAADHARTSGCGSTTCAPTSTSRSSRTRCAAATSTSWSSRTRRGVRAPSGSRASGSAPSPTTSS